MSTRTRHETVTFVHEFRLQGLEQVQPPGIYVLDIEEELITELSFPAYRRTATVMRLSSSQSGRYDVATIDPLDLDAALERDAVLSSINHRQSIGEIQTGAEPYAEQAPSSRSSVLLFSKRLRKAALRLRVLNQFGS